MAVFVAVRCICKKRKTGIVSVAAAVVPPACDKKYEKIVLNLVHAQIPLS